MNVYVLPALPTELCFHDWHFIQLYIVVQQFDNHYILWFIES